MNQTKREQVIEIATKLFYQYGFTATGVDKITMESGVTKKTIYSYFKSKDELILAVLRRRDEQFRNYFMRAVEQHGRTASERLIAIFTVLDAWLNSEGFFGCMFINAAAEFSEQSNPCHMMCSEHKRLMNSYIRDLATAAGAEDPESLSAELSLLIEGAIVQAHVYGDKQAGLRAKKMAQTIIHHAIST